MARPKPRTMSKSKATAPVAAPAKARGWTYEDYCAIPDDGLRYEVIGGELLVAPAPRPIHQAILSELAHILITFVKPRALGKVLFAPIDLLLAADGIVQPDLLFIRTEHLHIMKDQYVEGAPDLVVEVLSDSTAARDRSAKRDLYAVSGIPYYWIIAPRTNSLEEYELVEGMYRLRQRAADDDVFEPAVFPGLSFALTDLWR